MSSSISEKGCQTTGHSLEKLRMKAGKKNQPKIDVYRYRDFSSLFADYLASLAESDKKHSVRWVSKRLGVNHAHLVRISKGERVPSEKMVEKLLAFMKVKGVAANFVMAMAGFHRAKSASQKAYYADQLVTLGPKHPDILLDLDSFKLMYDWHHLAILATFELRDFMADSSWIAARLGGRVDSSVVEQSIEMMERLGLVEKRNGVLARRRGEIRTTKNIPSETIRSYHRQMIELSLSALKDQSVDERYFSGTTIGVSRNKLTEAQNLIGEFRQRFIKLIDDTSADEVYYLSLQFFRLTEPQRGGR